MESKRRPADPRPRRSEGADTADAAFRRLVESSGDIFWLADATGERLYYVSPSVAEMTGWSPEALIDDPEHWREAVVPDDRGHLPDPPFALRAGEGAPTLEYRVLDARGRERWLRDRRFPMHDARGRVVRVGGVIDDITERRQREQEREALLQREQQARAEAQALAASKDDFLAVVTHELRSPLNAIRGWAHLLRRGAPLDEAQLRALDAIDRNTQAQARLVDDLLDSQRILCGDLRLALGRAPLAAILDDAVTAVRPAAEAKRIRLDVQADPRLGFVTVDPERLTQALRNVLSNAVKFTPEDGIVHVRSQLREPGVAIEVQDTGEGLEPEQLSRVFERFQQGDSSNTRRRNGLGLGLSLARQLVELHGGRLDAASAGPGHGTTFTIELPGSVPATRSRREGGAANDRQAAPLAGKRIVIVEDDDDGRQILELLLRDAKVDLRSFDRAARALEYLSAAQPDDLPDAVISDIAMPDVDGYEFIRRLRDWEEGEHHDHRLLALAVTAFARAEDRRRALGAGFDLHLAKPFDSQAILQVLAEALCDSANDDDGRSADDRRHSAEGH